MSKRTNIEIAYGGSAYSRSAMHGDWSGSVVRRRLVSARSVSKRGHAKRRRLVKKRGQANLQGLAIHERRMRHVTRRESGPVLLSRQMEKAPTSMMDFRDFVCDELVIRDLA